MPFQRLVRGHGGAPRPHRREALQPPARGGKGAREGHHPEWGPLEGPRPRGPERGHRAFLLGCQRFDGGPPHPHSPILGVVPHREGPERRAGVLPRQLEVDYPSRGRAHLAVLPRAEQDDRVHTPSCHPSGQKLGGLQQEMGPHGQARGVPHDHQRAADASHGAARAKGAHREAEYRHLLQHGVRQHQAVRTAGVQDPEDCLHLHALLF
mmetsp:Transcript_57865/g.183525  ORF Transcript_57865/g.183525 Transcript_57865/m.183525 type:complete len:209 (-) Transcript_57865:3144-3770(-)